MKINMTLQLVINIPVESQQDQFTVGGVPRTETYCLTAHKQRLLLRYVCCICLQQTEATLNVTPSAKIQRKMEPL